MTRPPGQLACARRSRRSRPVLRVRCAALRRRCWKRFRFRHFHRSLVRIFAAETHTLAVRHEHEQTARETLASQSQHRGHTTRRDYAAGCPSRRVPSTTTAANDCADLSRSPFPLPTNSGWDRSPETYDIPSRPAIGFRPRTARPIGRAGPNTRRSSSRDPRTVLSRSR